MIYLKDPSSDPPPPNEKTPSKIKIKTLCDDS